MFAAKTNEFWSEWQGQTVESFALGELIGATKDGAVFATTLRDEQPAAIKVRLANASGEDRERGHWLAAFGLSHPNVIRAFATGTSEIGGRPVEYMLMERADETLAGALANRALTGSEMRELLTPALAALSYLHQNRFLHGSLHPSNVMGVDDTLKLSCDDLLRVGEVVPERSKSPFDPPEAYQGPASPAWNSWSIGALLVQSGTLQYPEIRDGRVEFPDLEPPFDEIARHTLIVEPERRWSISQIADAFEGRPVVPAVAPPAVAAEPPATLPSQSNRAPFTYQPRARDLEPVTTRPAWLVPAIGSAVVVLLLIWFIAKPSGNTVVKPAAPVPQAVAPAAPTPAPRTPPAPPPIVVKSPVATAKGWYVVVATYADKNGAEKRARAITSRWPRFRAQVFDPPAHDSHHLVVIGSRLTEDQASALRDRARSAGLPADVYIKKF